MTIQYFLLFNQNETEIVTRKSDIFLFDEA